MTIQRLDLGFIHGKPGGTCFQGHELVAAPQGLGGAVAEQNFYQDLVDLGLHGNAKVVLDMGSASTYAGSGQNVTDLTPNGFSFFRGTTNGAEASDPTFNGTPGALTSAEFFSVDGGDVFTYDTTNETAFNNLHKDNAIGTLIWWLRAETGANQGLLGTNGGSGLNIGIAVRINAAGTVRFAATNGAGDALQVDSSVSISDATNTMFGISWNEATGAGGGRFYKNDGTKATNTFTSTYTSPSASDASFTLQILSRGNTEQLMTSGGRLYGFILIEGTAFTETNFDDFFGKNKARFGL